MSRDDSYRDMGIMCLDFPHQFNAIAIRKLHVGQAQMKVPLLKQAAGLGQVAGRGCLQFHPSELIHLVDPAFVSTRIFTQVTPSRHITTQ